MDPVAVIECWLIAGEIAKATGQSLKQILMPTFRAPTRGVKLGVLAGGE